MIIYQKGYKYVLGADALLLTLVQPDAVIETKMIKLGKTGTITIKAGYAWDGPSGPTFDTKSSMQASLAHDALYQLLREGLLPPEYKAAADKTLEMIGVDDGMYKWRAFLWERAVSACGWRSAFQPREVLTAP